MKASKFYIIKKSAGYAIKSFYTENEARECATRACNFNGNQDFIVGIYTEGCFVEI